MDDAFKSFASISLASVDPGISIDVPITNSMNLRNISIWSEGFNYQDIPPIRNRNTRRQTKNLLSNKKINEELKMLKIISSN